MIAGKEKESIRSLLISCGAAAVGFAGAGEIAADARERFHRWIGEGLNAGMEFMTRHEPLRATTESVLEGAKTVISMAFGYDDGGSRDSALPQISRYAWRNDYHDSIRKILAPAVDGMQRCYPSERFRVCIDSAPVDERYWAMEAGIGMAGKNGSVIADGCGGYNFLVELITTLQIAPDAPSRRSCEDCGACRKACPTGALGEDGVIDCRRCLSYLTIEHRGEWGNEAAGIMATEAGKKTLFGCDRCLRACPHNRKRREAGIPDLLKSSDSITRLTPEDVLRMDKTEFSAFFRHSPIRRAKYEGLLRNARNCLDR